MKIETFNDMLGAVEEYWPFDSETYPELNGATEEQRRLFALKHILFHQTKATVKLTEVCEVVDHGKPFDADKLHIAVRNFLINTLRLARVVGCKEDQLKSFVRVWVEENIGPRQVSENAARMVIPSGLSNFYA